MTLRSLPRWQILLVFCIVLGAVLRCIQVESLVYWHDEAYTSLRISGYTGRELHQQLFDGSVVTVADLQRFQTLTPGRGLGDTVRSLALEDVQHPPLYYGLAWLWARAFGDGIVAVRSLSVVIGLLLLPGAGWLGWELFGRSRGTGWLVALVALSPMQLLFAQEAREYGLWTLLTVLSTAALVRALRQPGWMIWGLYGLLTVLSYYTYPFSVLVVAGQGGYILLVRWRQLGAWLGVVAIATLAYLPWLQVMLNPAARQGAGWTADPVPFAQLLRGWGLHLVRTFSVSPADGSLPAPLWGLVLLILLLLAASSGYLVRTTHRRVWLCALMLSASLFVPLVAIDLWQGGQRSLPSRYLVPSAVGLVIPVAYFCSHCLSKQRWGPWLWGGVLGLQLWACLAITQADTAWSKDISAQLLPLAAAINQAPQPLLVAPAFGINTGTVLAFSHYLKPNTRLQLIDDTRNLDFLQVPTLPPAHRDVFLLNGSLPLRLWLEHENGLNVDQAFNGGPLILWRLK